MIRIGCRAHDYGKHTPVQLAHILHTAGYTPTTMEHWLVFLVMLILI